MHLFMRKDFEVRSRWASRSFHDFLFIVHWLFAFISFSKHCVCVWMQALVNTSLAYWPDGFFRSDMILSVSSNTVTSPQWKPTASNLNVTPGIFFSFNENSLIILYLWTLFYTNTCIDNMYMQRNIFSILKEK